MKAFTALLLAGYLALLGMIVLGVQAAQNLAQVATAASSPVASHPIRPHTARHDN